MNIILFGKLVNTIAILFKNHLGPRYDSRFTYIHLLAMMMILQVVRKLDSMY